MVRTARTAALEHAVEQLDKLRRRAAAAARREQIQFPVGLHLHRVELGRDVVAGAVRAGQTGIGLDEHREIPRDGLGQPLRHRENFLGAERAVDAHGIRAQTPGRCGKAFDGAAREGAPARFKAHAGQHRQSGVFLNSQKRRFQFIEVGEGLQKHEVGSGSFARPDDAAKLGHRIFKSQRSVGFQQFAQRADVQRRQRAIRGTGPLAVRDARRDDLFQRIRTVGQLVGRCTKGVGVDDAASRRGIFCMDALDERRVRQVQFLRTRAQFQAGRLQHGPHAAIQQDGIRLGKQFIRLHR